MLINADCRGVMALVVCGAEVTNFNHYVACILLTFLFLPLGCAEGSQGNVDIQYVCCVGKGSWELRLTNHVQRNQTDADRCCK